MFPWDGILPEPQVRTIEELRPLLYDQNCNSDEPLYLMYRDLSRDDREREWLSKHHLRYDITVIPPRILCKEYVKTKGHYHPKNPAGIGYPEVYEVLEGMAHYLLQHRTLNDLILIPAVRGERVIIPPDYGHVTINPGSETLVMANIVSTDFSSEYDEYERYHGAVYYELEGGVLIKNPYYPGIQPLRDIPRQLATDILPAGSLSTMIGGDSLNFLNKPEEYGGSLSRLW
jgi:glucose-6-phosphate isomerase